MTNSPNDPNPYAPNPYAPSALPPVAPPNQSFSDAIFRRGRILMVHKQAIFPNRCVKTNQPTTERLKRTLYWHHPAIYLAILLNLIVYAILAIVLRKKAVFQVPVIQKVKNRRLAWMFAAWGSFIAAFFILFVSLTFTRPQSDLVVVGVASFFLLLFASALIGIFGCRVVYAKKIDEHFVWLGGTGQDFRESFPEWPY